MNRAPIADAEARRLAETTFDRNVVVIAGAGTGKTTLLANRLIHALMREPDPIGLDQIVAMTFTNKAAAEMKSRLRARLAVLAAAPDRDGGDDGAVTGAELGEAYGVTQDRIAERAGAALADIEKAQIGTLHSFAAHLLRLYPLESGVDPSFREDEGPQFDELFETEWDEWLEVQLSPKGSEAARWRRVLARCTLSALRDAARALADELVPLEALAAGFTEPGLSPAVRTWCATQQDHARRLLQSYDRPKRRKAEHAMDAVATLFGLLLDGGVPAVERLDESARAVLEKDLGTCPNGWSPEDFGACDRLVRAAKQILLIDSGFLADVVALLVPFVTHVRRTFVEQGWLSFDGLLSHARRLLRDHPRVRERLKREYRAILVDEFQDTDPAQYEIILFLAEREGFSVSDWRNVDPAPGKLFIVGDPKQSIYAFRRADIEAFERVVEKLESRGAAVHTLATNFRSDRSVLDVVNACFDRLLVGEAGIQPANVPLAVRPGRQPAVGSAGVAVRLVQSDEEEEFNAPAATRVEAERLAAWLADEVVDREVVIDGLGRRSALQPGHIALLFRKLTQAQPYLDALRRHGLHYVTDGEKHFYRRQEVIDLVNVLRVVDNPRDEIAMAGVLRSPLGGLTDRELYEVRDAGAFDCRAGARLRTWTNPRAESLTQLYARLAELHMDCRPCALPEVLDLIFSRLPVRELAMASLHGEQAAANLLKIQQIARQLADRPHMSLSRFVDVLISRLSEQPDEAETALGEESLSAIRVLTIHKAKGLEFPMVVLPGLHHAAVGRSDAVIVQQDWSSGAIGLTVAGIPSLEAVMVGQKQRIRADAEQRRLFYVGMTRARDRLVLSGGLAKRAGRGTFFSMLAEAAGTDASGLHGDYLHIGAVAVPSSMEAAADRSPRRARGEVARLRQAPDCGGWLQAWRERTERWETARDTPSTVTVSAVMAAHSEGAQLTMFDAPVARDGRVSRLIGTLAHRVLEYWDFAADPEPLVTRVLAAGDVEESHRSEAHEELTCMLRSFRESPACAELRRASIVGREVPFAVPFDDGMQPSAASGMRGRCILEGVLDIVYRLDGRLWIADYKTDRLESGEAEAKAAMYGLQARLYRQAVRSSVGEEPGFAFIFLRTGQHIIMET